MISFGFDVGAAASLAPSGFMSATLFASPGTVVRAAIIWATPAQVTQLTWTEIPYWLGRLDDAHFIVEDADVTVDEVFAYVHRLGSFCVNNSPVALAAIKATGRSAPEMTQEELLDLAAGLMIGDDARAEDLVREIYEDIASVTERASESVWTRSLPLQARWTPYPAAFPADQRGII